MTDYHWTPALEREFVEGLAETGSVTEACKGVSMSRRAAYDRRRRGAGLAFRIGWDAAVLLSRDVVADELLDRALAGQWTETQRDKDTGVTRRFAQDRRLGLALLSRLDQMYDFMAHSGTFHQAAQIVSQDFEAFLDLMVADPARSASVTEVRDFLSEREDAWRENDQLPCEDRVETKAVVVVSNAAIQCEVTQSSGVCEVEPSLRGAERRGNPEASASQSGLPRSARNDGGDEAEAELKVKAEIADEAPDAEPSNPDIIPFHSLYTSTPKPGQPGYLPWLRSQPWSRM